MSPDDRHPSLADDLAARTDEQLVDMLAARPDLASPPPAGVTVLARRAQASGSIGLVGESLDLLAVAVLEQFLAAAGPLSREAVIAALDGRADKDDIVERMDLLTDRALLWHSGEQLEAVANAGSALPWRGMHTAGPLAERTVAEVSAQIEALPEHQHDLLSTLATGSPLGRTRDAARDAPADRPVQQLLAAGLLGRVDDQTVELPPVVGALLRGRTPPEPGDLRRPELTPGSAKGRFSMSEVDAAGGGEALEVLRHVTTIIDALGAAPASVLRAGGLGVRELRRLAKTTEIDVDRLGFLVELSAAEKVVAQGLPDPPPSRRFDEPVWAPTTLADVWQHQAAERRWLALATAWLDLPRRPWQVGSAGADGSALPVLSGELHDVSAAIERRFVLQAMAESRPGVPVDVDRLAALLDWRHPRWARRLTPTLLASTLAEATSLGLVAHSALTSVGRLLVTRGGQDRDKEDWEKTVTAAMHKALPEPIDHFLTQADLTITAPGPLNAELEAEVALVADLESGGAASVYRVSETSIRRALDAGRSSSELLTLFTTHSRTPVPQSFRYLVEDVARRHGQLRVGMAGAFIRCEDAATLAGVLSSPAAATLALRELAPTVAVSPASLREVLDELRSAGFAPAGEDSTGAVVDLREQGSRVPVSTGARRTPLRRPGPAVPDRDQLQVVVARIRSQDAADKVTVTSPGGPARARGGGESATALLQLALRAARRVRVGYVDAHGSASRSVVRPRTLGAGQLVAVDETTDDEQRFSLHRITSVELLDS
ncbi:helicase-associated domain-containing protein [Williamsia sterculiae]|nr:helicase-associated domain-containing protein [Williamsia sterculiae]